MKKLKIFLIILLLISIAGLTFYLLNMNGTKEQILKKEELKEPVIVEKNEKVSLIMAGDVLIHDAVYKDAYVSNNTYDFTKMFTQIKPIVSNYDLAYINQETIIGGKALGLSNYPRFNSPEEIGDAVVDTGFNIIGLANNHTLDRGEVAVLNSDAYWKTKNVITNGAFASFEEQNKKNVYEKNGIKYAFFAYTVHDNGLKAPKGKEYLINLYSEERAKKDIEQVKNEVDIIIVAMHWGDEYSHTENNSQRTIANYLSELGVNIIVGTHPHVVQPITYINNTLVIYSLGNFISCQIGEEKLVGMMVSLNINKHTKGDDVNISLENVEGRLVYNKYVNYRNFQVIPFENLNNTILNNYQSIFEKYKNIVTRYDNSITVR